VESLKTLSYFDNVLWIGLCNRCNKLIMRMNHRNLKSRSIIEPWKVKNIGGKSVQCMSDQKQYIYRIFSMENLGGKIQFMIRSGVLTPWAFRSPFCRGGSGLIFSGSGFILRARSLLYKWKSRAEAQARPSGSGFGSYVVKGPTHLYHFASRFLWNECIFIATTVT
jgi:hypothetical protein